MVKELQNLCQKPLIIIVITNEILGLSITGNHNKKIP